MSGLSSKKVNLPKLSLSSSKRNIEGVLQILAWACFNDVNPTSGLEKLRDIQSWAQNVLDASAFNLLFSSFKEHSVSFGGFGLLEFGMDEKYGVPFPHGAKLCKDATTCYTKVTLDALLSQMHKIQTTIMAIEARTRGMTERPLQHMLPTEISEQYRCSSLYEVVLCVWTRMCHIWGSKKNYGEYGNLFAPQALTCFSLDGQTKAPYLWLDVDTSNRSNFVYSIQSHTFDAVKKRTFKMYIKPPRGKPHWVAFGLVFGQQLLVDETEVNTPDVCLLVYSSKDQSNEPFRVMQGKYHDNNYFLLVTERGAFRDFYRHEGNILYTYPALFHPMLEDALGVNPKVDVQKKPTKCSMCQTSGKSLNIYDFGAFCTKACLITYTQQHKIKNVKVEFSE